MPHPQRPAAAVPYAPDRTPAGPRDRGADPLDDHQPHARRRTLQREAA
ncbi:hypothetical protein KNE206_08410 [Kitasatospora sp. NE20-6]